MKRYIILGIFVLIVAIIIVVIFTRKKSSSSPPDPDPDPPTPPPVPGPSPGPGPGPPKPPVTCKGVVCKQGEVCNKGKCCTPNCTYGTCNVPNGCGGTCECPSIDFECQGTTCNDCGSCANRACGDKDKCGRVCTTNCSKNNEFFSLVGYGSLVSAKTDNKLTAGTPFNLSKNQDKYYEVIPYTEALGVSGITYDSKLGTFTVEKSADYVLDLNMCLDVFNVDGPTPCTFSLVENSKNLISQTYTIQYDMITIAIPIFAVVQLTAGKQYMVQIRFANDYKGYFNNFSISSSMSVLKLNTPSYLWVTSTGTLYGNKITMPPNKTTILTLKDRSHHGFYSGSIVSRSSSDKNIILNKGMINFKNSGTYIVDMFLYVYAIDINGVTDFTIVLHNQTDQTVVYTQTFTNYKDGLPLMFPIHDVFKFEAGKDYCPYIYCNKDFVSYADEFSFSLRIL